MALFDELKQDELNYMVQKGWLTPGAAAGTFKLTDDGLAWVDRILEGLTANERVALQYKITGNAEADPKQWM